MVITLQVALAILLGISISAEKGYGLGLGLLLCIGILIILVIVFLLLVAFISLFIRIDHPADKRTKFYRWLVNNIVEVGKALLRIRMHIDGKEKIPTDTRFLLVCNHRTIFDPVLAMGELWRYDLAFISKKENYNIPIVRKFMHMCFCLPIDRDNNREAVKTINDTVELINENVASFGIYPEGGTNKTDEVLLPFRNGAFKIAQKAKVPIVVCTMFNTEKILKNWPLKQSEIYLHVLDVIPVTGDERKGTKELSEEIWPMMYNDLCKDPSISEDVNL